MTHEEIQRKVLTEALDHEGAVKCDLERWCPSCRVLSALDTLGLREYEYLFYPTSWCHDIMTEEESNTFLRNLLNDVKVPA